MMPWLRWFSFSRGAVFSGSSRSSSGEEFEHNTSRHIFWNSYVLWKCWTETPKCGCLYLIPANGIVPIVAESLKGCVCQVGFTRLISDYRSPWQWSPPFTHNYMNICILNSSDAWNCYLFNRPNTNKGKKWRCHIFSLFFMSLRVTACKHPGVILTRRIIPVSKWFVTAIYKPFRPFGRDLQTVVINHLLVGMILQVGPLLQTTKPLSGQHV